MDRWNGWALRRTFGSLLLCLGSRAAAQIRVDSTSDSTKQTSSVLVWADGKVVNSQLGELHSVFTISCRNHEVAQLSLIATIAPGIMVHRGFYGDEQDVEVHSDSGKDFKLDMEVVTLGRIRWLVDDHKDDMKTVLGRMAAQPSITITWKLWNFEQAMVVFPLDTSVTDRQQKLGAPWLSCRNKSLW